MLMAGVAGAGMRPKAPVGPVNHVGLEERVFHPKAPRNWRGAEEKDLRCTIWYPAVDAAVEVKQVIGPPDAPLFEAGMASPHAEFAPSLSPFPLVVLSHGTGGSAEQMAWLGTALAKAGYIAVAVDHPGNNSHAPPTAEGFVLWWERATDLSEVIDGMLADKEFGPRIDTSRVAAAGFSIGGYTALAMAGAQTDISDATALCRVGGAKDTEATGGDHGDRDTTVCHVPEMKALGQNFDEVLRTARKTSGESLARSGESYRDARVKAVFAIAPAMGFTLTQESLHAMKLPVEVVVGSADRIAVARDNADYIHEYVRGSKETVLPNVGHYPFLDTCTAEGKTKMGVYCADDASVNRDAVHAQVTEEAVRFLDRALRM